MKFMFFSEAETLLRAPSDALSEARRTGDPCLRTGFDLSGVSATTIRDQAASDICPEVPFAYLFPLIRRFASRMPSPCCRARWSTRCASPRAPRYRRSPNGLVLNSASAAATRRWRCTPSKSISKIIAPRLNEGIRILEKAFTEDPFDVYGAEHDKIRRARSCRSRCRNTAPAARLDVGRRRARNCTRWPAISGSAVSSRSNFMGWDGLAVSVVAFRKASGETKARGEHVNESAGALLQAYCAEHLRPSPRPRPAPAISSWPRIAIDGYPPAPRWPRTMPDMNKITEVARECRTHSEYFRRARAPRSSARRSNPHSLHRALPPVWRRPAGDAHRQRVATTRS